MSRCSGVRDAQEEGEASLGPDNIKHRDVYQTAWGASRLGRAEPSPLPATGGGISCESGRFAAGSRSVAGDSRPKSRTRCSTAPTS